jgi:hypothetical protein
MIAAAVRESGRVVFSDGAVVVVVVVVLGRRLLWPIIPLSCDCCFGLPCRRHSRRGDAS